MSVAWQTSPGILPKSQRSFATDGSLINNDDIVPLDGASRRRFLYKLSSAVVAPFALPIVAIAEDTDIEAVENVVKEEQDLDSKLKQEESDEAKSIEDTKKLISEIEDEIKDATTNTDEESLIAEEQKIASDTEELIKEEEQIVGETQAILDEIEAVKSDATAVDKDAASGGGSASEEFVNKLKQRMEEKEDLITKLKRESEMYRDPETGKFKPMSQNEFKKRAVSTESDYDYVQILKDSLIKNEEFERDLQAFEGLLGRELNAVENEFESIKDGAESVIKRIRKLF